MAEVAPAITGDEILANTSMELARTLAELRRTQQANHGLAEENTVLHQMIKQLQTPQVPQKNEVPEGIAPGAPRRARREAARKGAKLAALPVDEGAIGVHDTDAEG